MTCQVEHQHTVQPCRPDTHTQGRESSLHGVWGQSAHEHVQKPDCLSLPLACFFKPPVASLTIKQRVTPWHKHTFTLTCPTLPHPASPPPHPAPPLHLHAVYVVCSIQEVSDVCSLHCLPSATPVNVFNTFARTEHSTQTPHMG